VIRVPRLDEPRILAERKAAWQAAFDEKRAAGKKRPESKQYAHKEIVERLMTMSHNKCFYCEAQGRLTVDHYLEVEERPELAFTWENLYLACDECQRKVPNQSLPAVDCVNPCDASIDPAEHLGFDAEFIRWKSPRGQATVKKYRLSSKELDNQRRRELRRFDEELHEISRTKGWAQATAVERASLRRYARADAPFSAMFRDLLDRYGLASDG
jgi:hypothetical protein